MKQFYDGGRKRELDGLENLYTKDEFTFAAVYGRKRIGKTSLIGEFISRGGKKAIRFTAAENTDAENLKAFSKEVFKVYPQTEQSGAFNNWNAAFNYAARKADGEKLILAIDEFPYAAKANADLLNALKKAIDGVFRSSKIMLIISGSNTNFMENRVFGRESPLCGKFTTKYELTPLDYYDSAEFFGNADAQDKLLGYAAAGGIPAYLNVIAKAYTVEDGIESAYFSKDGFFYEEPQNFLKEELREPALYNAILSEIAKNAAKLNAISAKLDEDNSKILKYIKSLIKLDAVEKEIPLGNDSPRSGTYRIKDNMFRFWYRFVQDERTSIENGEEQIYRKKSSP
jgi:AAA+ ATPase superfamily predicted ATPase